MKKFFFIPLFLVSSLVLAETPPAADANTATTTVQGPEITPEPPKVIDVLYVTDKLILGMQDNAEGKGKNIRLLRSGMKLDIVEKRGSFNKVRTSDGEIGWAKSTFMVKDQPALLVVKEIKKENAVLKKEIEALKKGKPVVNQVVKSEEGIDEEKIAQPLRQRIIELKQMLGEAQKQLSETAEVQNRPSDVMSNTDNSDNTVVIALVLLLIGLAIGFGTAFYLFQQRVKRRFAGLRV
jgi:hypothetical protein